MQQERCHAAAHSLAAKARRAGREGPFPQEVPQGGGAPAAAQPQDRADRSLAKIGWSFHSPRRPRAATVMNCGW